MFCNSVSVDRSGMVAQRLLTAAAACAILIFFAAESRKSQCGFGFGSVSVSSICYRPGSVYVRLRFLRFLVGFGLVFGTFYIDICFFSPASEKQIQITYRKRFIAFRKRFHEQRLSKSGES